MKKTRLPTSRLALDRETVRELTDRQSAAVHGGEATTTISSGTTLTSLIGTCGPTQKLTCHCV